jgi:hypothetical protein
MQQRPRAYQIVDNNLYKTSIIGPLLHCLSKAEGKELLAEIHSGVRGGHIGSRVLAAKVFRQGFYWPLVIDNASKIVATCRSLSKVFASLESSIPAFATHHTFMATPKTGHRHSGTAAHCPGKLQVCGSHHCVLYKMDRGEASSQHSLCITQEIFLAKHNLLIWSTKRDNGLIAICSRISAIRWAPKQPLSQFTTPSQTGR